MCASILVNHVGNIRRSDVIFCRRRALSDAFYRGDLMRFSIHFLGANGTPAAFHVFAHSGGRVVMVSPPGGLPDRRSVVDLIVRNGGCPEKARARIEDAALRHFSYIEL